MYKVIAILLICFIGFSVAGNASAKKHKHETIADHTFEGMPVYVPKAPPLPSSLKYRNHRVRLSKNKQPVNKKIYAPVFINLRIKTNIAAHSSKHNKPFLIAFAVPQEGIRHFKIKRARFYYRHEEERHDEEISEQVRKRHEVIAKFKNRKDIRVYSNFEDGSYNHWMLAGTCWGSKPMSSRVFGKAIIGCRGRYYLNTLTPKKWMATGKAVSKEFTITEPYIHYLIGGDNNPKECCFKLVINGKAVEKATGNGHPKLIEKEWDVIDYIGLKAHFEIIDSSRLPRGYIMVDNIEFRSH